MRSRRKLPKTQWFSLAFFGLIGLILAITSLLVSPSVLADSSSGKMYWINRDAAKIQRANLDGSDVEDLITKGFTNPTGIALDMNTGKMYWTDGGEVQRANLDGSDVETLVSSGSRGITVDSSAQKMYWVDVEVNIAPFAEIGRANFNGNNVETLIGPGTDPIPWNIALDRAMDKIYWTDPGGKIQRANLDGTNVENILTNLGNPQGLAIDADKGKIYWTDWLKDKITRANLDGSNVEDLVSSGLDIPQDITLDLVNDKMYWTDSGTGKIKRANLGGSGAETLVSGLGKPQGIALALHAQPSPNTPPTCNDISVTTSTDTPVEIDLSQHCSDTEDDPLTGASLSDPAHGTAEFLSPTIRYTPDSGFTGSDSFTFTVTDGARESKLVTVEVTVHPNTSTPTDKIYWIATGSDSIHKAKLDGGNVNDLITTGLMNPSHITVNLDNETMYWSENEKIKRANLDGTGEEVLIDTDYSPFGLALDRKNNKLYWSGPGAIYRSNLDGTNVGTVLTGLKVPSAVALDVFDNKIYWARIASGDEKIKRANLDGTGEEILVDAEATSGPVGLTLDRENDKIYWTEGDPDRIRRANLDGSELENLRTFNDPERFPAGIALDPTNEKIYWTDVNFDEILEASTDGSNLEILISGLDSPTGIALAGVTQPPSNNAPNCSDISVTISKNKLADIDLSDHCSDPEGDSLSGATLSDPDHGTAEFLSPTIRYTPNSGFIGSDSFTYTVTDGSLESDPATVDVTVNAENTIAQLIQSNEISKTEVSVNNTIYFIVEMDCRIDPDILECKPAQETVTVYVSDDYTPVSDPSVVQKVNTIDHVVDKADITFLDSEIDVLKNLKDGLPGLLSGQRRAKIAQGISDIEGDVLQLSRQLQEAIQNLENTGKALTRMNKIRELASNVRENAPTDIAFSALEWALRQWIWDPMDELKEIQSRKLQEGIEAFEQAQSLKQNQDLTQYENAIDFLVSLRRGQLHQKETTFLFEKIYNNLGVALEKIASSTVKVFGIVKVVREAGQAVNWEVNLTTSFIRQRGRESCRDAFWFNSLDPAKHTLKLGTVENIHKTNLYQEYSSCIDKNVDKPLNDLLEFFDQSSVKMIGNVLGNKVSAIYASLSSAVSDILENQSLLRTGIKNSIFGKIRSPGELRVIDSRGNVTGKVDGEAKAEIPNSEYSDELIVLLNTESSYQYEVHGEAASDYGLKIIRVHAKDTTNTLQKAGVNSDASFTNTTFVAQDIATLANAKHTYTVNWDELSQGEQGVTVEIDDDGDGTPEETINSGESLSGTETGSGIQVEFSEQGITLRFDEITSDGFTDLTTASDPPFGGPFTTGFITNFYDIETTAEFSGNVTVQLSYDDSSLTENEEANLKLFKVTRDGEAEPEDITTSVDTQANTITGKTDGFSFFAIGLGGGSSPQQQPLSVQFPSLTTWGLLILALLLIGLLPWGLRRQHREI